MKHLETVDDVLASARVGLEPSALDRARVRQRVLRRAAAFGALGTATALKSAAASVVGGSGAASVGASHSLVALAKVFASSFVLCAAGATTVVVGIESVAPPTEMRAPSSSTHPGSRKPTVKAKRDRAPHAGAIEQPSTEPESERDASQPSPHPATSAERAPAGAKPTDTTPATLAPIANDLDGELVLLQAAREAVTAGRTQEARRLLGQLEQRYPSGLLIEERAALSVITSCSGAPDAVRTRIGARFLTAHPGSVYGARVRLVCGTPTAARERDRTNTSAGNREPLTDHPPRGH